MLRSNFMTILSIGLLLWAGLPVEGFLRDNFPAWFRQPCTFTCTTPIATTVATITTTAILNGCQGLGLYLPVLNSNQTLLLNQCCNSVQLCYNTCGSLKNNCDLTFKTCVDNACKENEFAYGRPRFGLRGRERERENRRENCEGLERQLRSVQNNCAAFLSAQKRACNC